MNLDLGSFHFAACIQYIFYIYYICVKHQIHCIVRLKIPYCKLSSFRIGVGASSLHLVASIVRHSFNSILLYRDSIFSFFCRLPPRLLRGLTTQIVRNLYFLNFKEFYVDLISQKSQILYVKGVCATVTSNT